MRRYWLESPNPIDSILTLQGDVFHHIFDVCRQTKGSKFEVLGLPGKALLVEVIEIQKKKALVKILEERAIAPLPRPHLILALSVPRFPVMDAVVERAVEMGVAEIRPFLSDFSFVRDSKSIPEGKKERWNKIVVSASQQSGRGELLKIHPPAPMQELIAEFNRRPQARGLFAYEGSTTRTIREELSGAAEKPEEVWIFVGSEGGFSHQEIQWIQDQGLVPVTLGDQVLRVETACIALVSVLKYEFGLMA